jgi:hypothetical protein
MAVFEASNNASHGLGTDLAYRCVCQLPVPSKCAVLNIQNMHTAMDYPALIPARSLGNYSLAGELELKVSFDANYVSVS